MGVNPVTGGDGAVLIKEIRESPVPDFHPSSAVPLGRSFPFVGKRAGAPGGGG